MRAALYHVSINTTNVSFYKTLLAYLGFRVVAEYANGFGASDGACSVWVFRVAKKHAARPFHRKAIGLNHIAFRVGSAKDVDDFYNQYLLVHTIPVLYGGPKLYPQYEPGYYAVYFEDPGRIKLEVVYKPTR